MLYPNFEDLIAFKNKKSKIAYPSLHPMKATRQGGHRSLFRGQGLEFDAVREYVPGDDIRNIDWRVTARMGAPHLKLFKEERERPIVICLDMNETMRFGTKRTFKSIQAAHAAAFLGWQALAENNSVSGCLFGDVPGKIQFYAAKSARQSFCTMLRTLTLPPTHKHQIPIHQALGQLSKSTISGSLVYIISDFIDFDVQFQERSGLNLLRKNCDIVFISINDQADKTLPQVGTILFSSTNGKMLINTQNASGRDAYAKQWKTNREQLSKMVDDYRIPLIELSTESDIPSDLTLSLKKIAKRRIK